MNASDPRYNAMKEIRDEILVLKSSPLYEYRTKNRYHPVIGEGSHYAKIMFIGEAPGENEAIKARPFCGAAGRILDELLKSINLGRNDVYVTNIVKDRPPENRDPTPQEIELYSPFLDRQIDVIQPAVIATLGRFSMKYIMDKYELFMEAGPISRLHGQIFDGIEGARNHDGGRIAFGPDGYLYVTTGDAQNTAFAQNKNSLNGKNFTDFI